MAGNRIELWGRVLGEPELRTTPAGTSVLRIQVEAADAPGAFVLGAVMTGEEARLRAGILNSGTEVMVKGTLKAIRRRLKSGLPETAYEVVAESIEVAAPVGRQK